RHPFAAVLPPGAESRARRLLLLPLRPRIRRVDVVERDDDRRAAAVEERPQRRLLEGAPAPHRAVVLHVDDVGLGELARRRLEPRQVVLPVAEEREVRLDDLDVGPRRRLLHQQSSVAHEPVPPFAEVQEADLHRGVPSRAAARRARRHRFAARATEARTTPGRSASGPFTATYPARPSSGHTAASISRTSPGASSARQASARAAVTSPRTFAFHGSRSTSTPRSVARS